MATVADTLYWAFVWPGYVQLTAFCVVVWLVYLLGAIKNGVLTRKPSQGEEKELQLARARLWDLSKQWEGLSHRFLRLGDGFTFHYVTNATTSTPAGGGPNSGGKPLVIFLHGFPDSWAVWRNVIAARSLQQRCTIVAPDLPGYGGSDSLADYSPDNLLGRVAAFIVEIRKRHDSSAGTGTRARTIIVAHDWGAAVAFRLASEAPQLADRFIIANGPLNYICLDKADDMKGAFVSQLRRGALRQAMQAIRPLLWQLLMSHYIIMFQSPWPLLKVLATAGHHAWVRLCHRHVSGQAASISTAELQEFMAATLGPQTDRLGEYATPDGQKYPASVLQRHTRSFVLRDPMRYYRDGAFTGTWTKADALAAALERLSPCPGPSGDRQGRPYVKQKTTVLWGVTDLALSRDMCLDGLEQYLVPGSQVVELPRSGHGVPVESESCCAVVAAVEWAVGNERGDLARAVRAVYQDARITERR
ncbi:hypothetical protein KEM52_000271 [Ascosphaera acerosa]|nr:hypothetical protein KEM52_000271 [Ascosphaera acerosa]